MPLVYSKLTNQSLAQLRRILPQGLLLDGMEGVGLFTTAVHLAASDTVAIVRPTDSDGNIDTTAKGIIRIAQIHQLQSDVRGKSTRRRVVIIDDADRMNTQAQNALLKLLEEPTPSVHFILTAHHPHLLLPTVLSRLQRVTIHPLSSHESQHVITSLGTPSPQKLAQLLFIAEGRPAELHRLMSDDAYFAKQATLVGDARTLISGSLEAKVTLIAQYQSDRATILQLLEMARSIILFSMQRSATPELVSLLDRLAATYTSIASNGNIRLQLVNFVIQ